MTEYESECNMKTDLDEAIENRDKEQPMPSQTTTEKLMQPGGSEEVEG